MPRTAQFLCKLKDFLAITNTQSTKGEKEKEAAREKETERQQPSKGEGGEGKDGSGSSSVLGLLHTDVHPQGGNATKSIEYVADTVIKMNTIEGVPYPSLSDERRCDILNKRLSGRVSREVLCLFLLQSRCFIDNVV